MTSAIERVAAHEKECAIRYENIEKRLDQGQARFARLENMIWGLYVLLISSMIGIISQTL
jgi:predicted RNase H-like nuclease